MPRIVQFTSMQGLPLALNLDRITVVSVERAKATKRTGPKPEDVKEEGEFTSIVGVVDGANESMLSFVVKEDHDKVKAEVWPTQH